MTQKFIQGICNKNNRWHGKFQDDAFLIKTIGLKTFATSISQTKSKKKTQKT